MKRESLTPTAAIKKSVSTRRRLYYNCALPWSLSDNSSTRLDLASLLNTSLKGLNEQKRLAEIYDTGFSPYAPLDAEGNTALHLIGKEGWEEGARFFQARFPDFDLGYRNKNGEVPIILRIEASAKRTTSSAELTAKAPRAKRARVNSEFYLAL